MTLGAPLLRGVIGALFVGHGTQKLFGWFGGPGLEGVKGMMESLELRPPKRHAVAAGLSEPAGEPTGRFTRTEQPVPAAQ